MTTRILVTPDYPHASESSSDVAAVTRPQTGSAESPTPSRGASLFLLLANAMQAARRFAGGLSDRFAEWCRDTFGEMEFVIGDFCAVCNDVHEPGARCPRALIGRCIDCAKWRALDRFGNCGVCNSRSITSRRLRYPNARRTK